MPRLSFRAVIVFVLSGSAVAQTYTIQTLAGGGLPQKIQGTSAQLGFVSNVAVDPTGNVFMSLDRSALVLRMDRNGLLLTVAGNGTSGYSGDNGPAVNAMLGQPEGIAVDAAGNLYIADAGNGCIRMVSNGIISTVAGTCGTYGFIGDNGPATSAQLNSPSGVAVDAAGNIYIADYGNGLIREVSNGTINTVAGVRNGGDHGDSISATSAFLSGPVGIALDNAGNLYIAEYLGFRIRKVSNGIITTVAGNGTLGFSGDNGPATDAQMEYPSGIAVDGAGNLYIVDAGNDRIREVANGVITTVAGNGNLGFSGDNVPATSAQLSLSFPNDVAVGSSGSLFIADGDNGRVRKVSNGVISTIAGGGPDGDNGTATSAELFTFEDHSSKGVAVDTQGNVYVADFERVRGVSNGMVTTVAGNGTGGFSGDGGLAVGASVDPAGIAVDTSGNLFLVDFGHRRVRKVSNGVITTVAGNGMLPFLGNGDNGPATSAQLSNPSGVAVDAAGNLYIADTSVRKVSNGVITTLVQGFPPRPPSEVGSGPGRVAYALAVDSSGNLFIADRDDSVIWKVSNGVVTQFAGNETFGFSGDNGLATNAQLSGPTGVAVDGAGNVYIADTGNNRIRRVSNGIITTIAGIGTVGFSGDNGPAPSAQLNDPAAIAVDAQGNVYVSDQGNDRVRVLIPPPASCGYSINPTSAQAPASGGSFTITVMANPACSWSVTSNAPWITINGTNSGTGNGSVTYQVNENTGAARSGMITVAGLFFTVEQSITTSNPPSILTDGTGVINGGSYLPGNIVSGSWVAIKGTGFTNQTMDWSNFDFSKGVLPTTLNGVQVLFNGQPGAIWYLITGTPQQINVQAPANLSGSVSVQVVRSGLPGNTVTAAAVQAAPAIFPYTLDGGKTFYPSAVFLDGTRLGDPAISPGARKAMAGDHVSLYANSLAPSPAGVVSLPLVDYSVTVSIGAVIFPADFAGLVAPGEFLINITVPKLPATADYPITLQIFGQSSPANLLFPYEN